MVAKIIRSTCLTGAVAAMAVLCVGIAHGQDRQDCALYDELLAAAPSGFEDLRGDAIFGSSNTFQSKKMLPGMYCAVTQGDVPGFACYGPPLAEIGARRSYETRLTKLRNCFADWETAPLLDVESPIKAVDSLRFIRRVDGGVLSIGVILAVGEVDGATEWRAGFGASWAPDDIAV